MFQVRADLDALHTLTLETARGFGGGLFVGVALLRRRHRDEGRGDNALQVDVQPGGVRALVLARGGERGFLQEAVNREGGAAAGGDGEDEGSRE